MTHILFSVFLFLHFSLMTSPLRTRKFTLRFSTEIAISMRMACDVQLLVVNRTDSLNPQRLSLFGMTLPTNRFCQQKGKVKASSRLKGEW